MRPETPSFSWSLRQCDLVALVAILLVSAIRLWFVASGQLNLVQDEAQYWDWSRTLQLSYYSKPPLIAYVIRLGTMLFGHTELGVRFFAIAGSALAQGLVYFGASRFFGRPRLGLWALFVANTLPLFMASGIMMTTDNQLVVCWLAAMFALYRASGGGEDTGRPEESSFAPYAVLGLAVAVGTLAKYTMLLFLPLALVHGIVLHRRGLLPSGHWTRLISALFLGSCAGLAPILAWNVQNDFVGFRHVTHLTGVEGKAAQRIIRFDRLPEYLGGQIGLLTPWWLVMALIGGWSAARAAYCRSGLNELFTERQGLLLALGFWPLWLFLLAWSLHSKVLGNWPAVSYASGLFLAAAGLEACWGRLPGIPAAGFWGWWARRPRLWVGLGVATFLVLNLQSLMPLPVDLNPAARLKGWHDLGEKLDELRTARFIDPDKVFYFADSYDMTAALAFYAPGQPRAYSVNLGRRMSQYDLWPGPQDKRGWDALMVRKGFEYVPPRGLEALFDSVQAVTYRTTHHGQPAREFTIWLCTGFRGEWPGPDGRAKEY